MTKIKIITDSTAELTASEMEKYQVEVLPLLVDIDGQTYNSITDLTSASFIQKMNESRDLPKSSQPSLGTFVETYKQAVAEGYQVLSLHLTEKLSGTVNTAKQAAAMVDGDITVIDTDYTARGQAFQVIEAAKMAQTGNYKLAEIVARLTEIRTKTKLYIVVVTLENLVKGGRVGKMQGLLGNLLNIKLIARLHNGELKEETKVRSLKKVITYLTTLLKNETQKIKQLDIVHANGLNPSLEFQTIAKEIVGNDHISIFEADPVITTHAGNGAFAVMYYTE